MTGIQEITANEQGITESVTLLDLRRQLDHLDTYMHEIHQQLADLEEQLTAVRADSSQTRAFIVLHEPTLARALKFFDNPVTRYKAAMAARKEDRPSE